MNFYEISNWIFKNPWKMGILTFFFLLTSYGLSFSIKSGVGLDTATFVQALSNPYYDGSFLYHTLNDWKGYSFFGIHFQPYLFALYFLKFVPYPNIGLYCIAYASLSLSLVFGLKTIEENKDLNLHLKIIIFISCCSIAFWQGLTSFEFHELALVPLFYILLYRSWLKKSYISFFIFALLALCLKETVQITYIFCGLLLFVFTKDFNRKIGLTILILGLIFYCLYFHVISPALRGNTESFFINYYSHLGHSTLEIILSPIMKPIVFIKTIFLKKNLPYFIYIFLPLLPFLKNGWKYLAFGIPTIGLAALSTAPNLTNHKNQYAAELLIPMCLVIYYGAIAIQEKINQNKYSNLHKKFTFSIAVFCFLVFFEANPIRSLKHQIMAWDDMKFAYTLTQIPLDKVVYTNTDETLPFIAKRPGLIFDNNSPYFQKKLKDLNLHPDYAVIKGDINTEPLHGIEKNDLVFILKSKDYTLYKVQ